MTAKYDYDTIHSIVDTARVVHVAFPPDAAADDPFPALLPMIGCTGTYDASLALEDDNPTSNAPRDIYLHGYVSSRLMRLAHPDKSNGFTDEPGLPVSVSATLVDGLILSLTPNSHSYNFRSAVVHGLGELVTDVPEKLWAMRQITNSVLAGRWEGSRTPPNATEMASTQILRVRVVGASAKVRVGQAHDEKHDLANASVVDSVWTGVVPCFEVLSAPVKCDGEKKTEVPQYVLDAVAQQNKVREEYSKEAMVEPVKTK